MPCAQAADILIDDQTEGEACAALAMLLEAESDRSLHSPSPPAAATDVRIITQVGHCHPLPRSLFTSLLLLSEVA